MRILFITTKEPESQNDLLEVSILHGLRSVMGKNCVDYPRKRIMYHDFSESPKDELHGKGFSVLTEPIEDLTEEERRLDEFDAVIYGDGHMRGEMPEAKYKNLAKNGNYWVLDGHDLDGDATRKIKIKEGNNVIEVIGTQFQRSFKRELVESGLKDVYPTGFGIPKHRIMDLDLTKKEQIYQKTAPDFATFTPVRDFGDNTFAHHTFTDEGEYYDDLHRSWFGLTCRKGGWDCLRHYEVIAAGSVLLFRDYNLKPAVCSPQCIPCLSYSTKEELDKIINRLVVDNKPTEEYIYYLERQREWLYNIGTTEARANHIISVIKDTL
jgi:hypothetical protein